MTTAINPINAVLDDGSARTANTISALIAVHPNPLNLINNARRIITWLGVLTLISIQWEFFLAMAAELQANAMLEDGTVRNVASTFVLSAVQLKLSPMTRARAIILWLGQRTVLDMQWECFLATVAVPQVNVLAEDGVVLAANSISVLNAVLLLSIKSARRTILWLGIMRVLGMPWESFHVIIAISQANAVMESGHAMNASTISARTAEHQKLMEAARRCIL